MTALPEVLQAMEAAKSEILARAYLQRIAAAQAKPTPEEVRKYYAEHPELFAQRRLYSLEEIAVARKEVIAGALREQAANAGSMQEIADWLKARGVRYTVNGGARAARERATLASQAIHRHQRAKELGSGSTTQEERKMFARRIMTMLTAAIAAMAATLLAQAQLLSPTVDRLTRSSSAANWTLGGIPSKLIPVPVAAPVGTGTCPGVRPGAIVLSDVGRCTFNFLFQGSDGLRYIGTAGHCILGESPVGGDVGESWWALGTGPVARSANGNRIGEFAYAILQDPKDFALIRLDPGVQASAGMCHFGGPTAANDDQPGLTQPVVLNYFGNGIGVGALLPARSALAAGMPDPDHVFAQGVAVPGDSGSGIISSDGRAVGVVVTVGVHFGSIGLRGLDSGVIGITRLSPQVQRAQQVLGVNLDLQEGPLQ